MGILYILYIGAGASSFTFGEGVLAEPFFTEEPLCSAESETTTSRINPEEGISNKTAVLIYARAFALGCVVGVVRVEVLIRLFW